MENCSLGQNEENNEDDIDDIDYYDYMSDDNDIVELEKKHHAEVFSEELRCRTLNVDEVELFLEQDIQSMCDKLSIPSWLASLLLRKRKWDLHDVEREFMRNPYSLLSSVFLIPSTGNCFTSDSPDFVNVINMNNQNQKAIRRSTGLKLKERTTRTDACPICLSLPTNLEDLAQTVAVNCAKSLTVSSGGPRSRPGLLEDASAIPSGDSFSVARLYGMSCGHCFCLDCWRSFFDVQIQEAVHAPINIECMEAKCKVRITDNFVLLLLRRCGSPNASRYCRLLRNEMIQAHPRLRPCIQSQCSSVVQALEEPKARRVRCETCSTEFCFACGIEYHAPTDCDTIKRWLQKCRDDSGTVNYMAAHTKDCPQCGVCIEKNGGCNHMQCSKCHYAFCWVCLGPWQTHSAQFYICSKYRESANLAQETARNRAREYLKRYFFYFERWENHERSLRLEQEHYATIQSRIQSKVLNGEGTWIDWQYLLTAAGTLRKCRYTLKYTYPYAYYSNRAESMPLFEYQQGLLEAEVEDLSWKIAHAEITDKGELLNKMNICEKHRQTLLLEFLSR